MTARGDYISLWWPGAPLDADHFWSKPVLSFWIMSLAMHLFGRRHTAAGALAMSHGPNGRSPAFLLSACSGFTRSTCACRAS